MVNTILSLSQDVMGDESNKTIERNFGINQVGLKIYRLRLAFPQPARNGN